MVLSRVSELNCLKISGLPVAARDAIMPEGTATPGTTPQTGGNREFFNNINEAKVAEGNLPFDRAQYDPLVAKIARTGAYYDRNRAQICSFFVKGECYRGDTCPYRYVSMSIKSPT